MPSGLLSAQPIAWCTKYYPLKPTTHCLDSNAVLSELFVAVQFSQSDITRFAPTLSLDFTYDQMQITDYGLFSFSFIPHYPF